MSDSEPGGEGEFTARHTERDELQGYTAAYTKAELVNMLRSGKIKSRAELVSLLSHNQLGKPENVDTLYVRPSNIGESDDLRRNRKKKKVRKTWIEGRSSAIVE